MKEGLTRCLEFTTLDHVFQGSPAVRAALWAVYTHDIKYESIWNDIFRGATSFTPLKVNRADLLSRCAFWDPLDRATSPSRRVGQSCCTMYPVSADPGVAEESCCVNQAPSLGSHPLSDPNNSSVTHEELLLLYDSLAYNKAASILLMADAATRRGGPLTLWQTAVAYLTCELDRRGSCTFEVHDLFEAAALALNNRRIMHELNQDAELSLTKLSCIKPIPSLAPFELAPTGEVPLDRVLKPWLELRGLPM